MVLLMIQGRPKPCNPTFWTLTPYIFRKYLTLSMCQALCWMIAAEVSIVITPWTKKETEA